MCVILACKDQKPSLEILMKCERSNPHGAGFMHFNQEGKVWYKKGLNANEVHELVEKIDLPFVIHFRWASGGFAKDRLLAHPFEVTETSDLQLEGVCDKALMHNGHFNDWKLALFAAGLDEPRGFGSDSRAISMVVSKDNLKFLQKLRGYFVVADSSVKKYKCYGPFKEENGIYYSNLTWKHKVCKTYCSETTRESVYDNDVPRTDANEKKTTKTDIPTVRSTSSKYIGVKQIVLPVLNKTDLSMDQINDLLIDSFFKVCPEDFSMKKKKRVWKRLCALNGYSDLSFKLYCMTEIEKRKEGSANLSPLSLQTKMKELLPINPS